MVPQMTSYLQHLVTEPLHLTMTRMCVCVCVWALCVYDMCVWCECVKRVYSVYALGYVLLTSSVGVADMQCGCG